MIDVKILAKQRQAQGSGTGSGTSGGVSSGTIEEALHATRADKATRADAADQADYAKRAGLSQRATVADRALEIDGDAEILQKYVRKDIDDTVHGKLTMEDVLALLKGFKLGSDGKYHIDEAGVAVLKSLVVELLQADDIRGDKALLQALEVVGKALFGGEADFKAAVQMDSQLHVKGATQFDDAISSPDFASGFLDGKGWRLKNQPVINAAGAQENRYTLELDNLIVRGTMRIFEMIISQLLGENDNRIFTAMLEVDHYDAASGKVYLDTHEGRMYNPFRKDDCVMVQQYGGISESGNDHTVTKQYELIVTEAGSEGTGEKMLAWVKFKNFTSPMEGATPDKLIAKRDTFVRVDNLTDPDRKGIIQMMTVGTDTPYMDILYGLKTDPDNALKGRLGNLQGITHPLFGALKGFGEFLQNLYATGDFIIRRTGESIDTKIQMLQSQFATRFAQTSYEVTEESNYLHNGQFLSATGDNDEQLIDGWTINDAEDSEFWVDANGLPVMVNGAATVSGNHRVSIDNNEGRNMLHIQDSGITQANSIIRKPGTHKEYIQPAATEGKDGMKATGDTYQEVQDTLYVSARIYAKTAGTLTFGFVGCEAVDGKTNGLSARKIDVPYSGEWQTVELEGKWNGTGDFVLSYTGDIYVSLLTITDEPLDNLSKTVSTQIQQTATNIKLLGQNIDKVNGIATQLGIELDAEKKAIRLYVDEQDAALKKSLSSSIEVQAGRIDLINTWQNETSTKISGIYTDIDSITSRVENVTKTADGNKAALAELEITVNGISAAVGKAATKEELTNANRSLLDVIDNNYKEVSKSISDNLANAKDYADGIGSGIRNDYAATISLVQQKADSWSVAAGAFDKDGHLIECSGMTVGTFFADLFSKRVNIDGDGNITNISKSGLLVTADRTALESKISTVDGKIISKATIETMIANGISSATITADQINLNGAVTANNYFKINTDGSMEAVAGTIGGFEIGSNYIGTKKNTTSGSGGTDIGYGTVGKMSLYDDSIIFNGQDRQAIFGQWSTLGTAIMMRLIDDHKCIEDRYGASISVRGSVTQNTALAFGGGHVSGLNLKTFVSAFAYITQSSVPARLNVNLDRTVGAAYISTQFYWRAKATNSNGKEVDYETKTRDIYVYLPEMNHYDDGHIIRIKRGVNNGSKVYVVPGKSKNLVASSSGWNTTYTTETSQTYLLTNDNGNNVYTYGDSQLAIDSEGDAMVFVYFKDLIKTVTVNNVKKTYKGCWVQWKNPRVW